MSAVLEHKAPAVQVAAPTNGDAAALMRIIDKATFDPQFDVAKLAQLLAVRDQWAAGEARNAYNQAFANFKAEAVVVVKNRPVTDGPLKGKSYAELFSVVNAVTPLLSKHGLSHSWKVTKDERDWIEVTCTLKHVAGHSEAVSFGGPPDAGGAKNAIQARASTLTYLERYTLKAICGIAEGSDDNDGNGGEKNPKLSPEEFAKFKKAIEAATSKDKAKEEYRKAVARCNELSDTGAHEDLKAVLLAHGKFIDGAAKAQ